MSDVQFEENTQGNRPFLPSNQTPTFVNLLIKLKIVQDAKQANYVLIGISVCAFLATLFVIKVSFFSAPAQYNRGIPGAGAGFNQGVPRAIPTR